MTGRRAFRPATLALHAGLLLAAAVCLLPMFVMLATTFKPMHEIVEGSMLALPRNWTTAPL